MRYFVKTNYRQAATTKMERAIVEYALQYNCVELASDNVLKAMKAALFEAASRIVGERKGPRVICLNGDAEHAITILSISTRGLAPKDLITVSWNVIQQTIYK